MSHSCFGRCPHESLRETLVDVEDEAKSAEMAAKHTIGSFRLDFGNSCGEISRQNAISKTLFLWRVQVYSMWATTTNIVSGVASVPT